ncbi:uncharacterized protein [Nicotiana tomentosiformis]|uniref:uncharacterized protein n=1 Tax=Nicotiana tomentosiformis TaxID=4098 RepID=UPI00388C4C0E
MCGSQDGHFYGRVYMSYPPLTPYFDGSSFSCEVYRNKEPRDDDLKEIKDMLKCLVEQNNEKQLHIQRQDTAIRNLEAQVSQIVEACNAQQANIMDSSQEKHALDNEIEVLMEEVKVEHQQSIQLDVEDVVVVEKILESTKDIEDTYLVDSSVIVYRNKEPRDDDLKEIKDMLKCLVEQNNEKQLHIQRQDTAIRNLEAQVSQLVEACNAQQANIVDSSQEKHALDNEIEVLMEEVKVEHQQSIQLDVEDVVVVEKILESTKDIEDTYLVDSSVIGLPKGSVICPDIKALDDLEEAQQVL